MTRIYTNIPSMIAQANLQKNMSSLETSLERLSTGFKINSGKDDPAGLIASEMLRSDITGIKTAISNTERANMMIATADSALNEVANLLNDIRGLVTEAANTGAMSAEMIAANQLQVDASLDAIDRISAQTSFMGQKLLDGSLDFNMSGIDRNNIQGLAVHQATFGTDKTPIDVNVEVRQAAEKAALYYKNPALADDIVLQWGGNLGYATETFQRGASVKSIADVVNASSSSTGVIAEVGSDAINGTLYTSSLGADNDIIITAGASGTAGGNIEVKYVKGNSDGVRVEYQEPVGADTAGKLIVYLQTEEDLAAVAKEVDTTPGVHDNNALIFTSNIKGGQYNDASINFVDGAATQRTWDANNPTGTAETPYAYYNDTATSAKALFGDVNGLGNMGCLDGVGYVEIYAREAGELYNNTAIVFSEATTEIPAGRNAFARYSEDQKQFTIYYKPDVTTFNDVSDALKTEGHFAMNMVSIDDADPVGAVALSGAAYDPDVDPATQENYMKANGYGNTGTSGGDAGTLFIVLPENPEDSDIDANYITKMLDIDDPLSRGSERAAHLFNVQRTADNDGTGFIHMYDFPAVDPVTGDPILDPITGEQMTTKVKPEYYQAFQGGQTGGAVVTTGAELVTALNNSAYWGQTMCPEMLAELSQYNANGTFFDETTPPVITAKLAPYNRGLTAVSTFEEVAYYGNPVEGNGLQFLGDKDSPNIRFVAEPVPNDHLWIDRTTVPDVVDFSQGVLTATDPLASMVITANKKGGDYDDVQFVFKRINEDQAATLAPDRANGWVEYDPAQSYAEGLANFTTGTGANIANSAFYVTATNRGENSNDVRVAMTTNDTQTEPIVVSFDEATKQLKVSLYTGNLTPPETDDPLDPAWYKQINTNDVIAAINSSDLGFKADLSYAIDQSQSVMFDYDENDWVPAVDDNGDPYPIAYNDGTGTFDKVGLKLGQLTTIANTGTTGGHNGTVTVWLTDQEYTDANGDTLYREPNTNDVIRLLSQDKVVGQMFNARTYTSGDMAGTGKIDFVKDTNVYTSGGLVEKGTLTVHLVTDKNGLVTTTANDLAKWWDQQDPAYVDNISVSVVLPPGAEFDECNPCDSPYGNGLLGPTVTGPDECGNYTVDDIQFVGWNDSIQKQTYVPMFASGTMTSDNGEDSSYKLVAKKAGPDYNGYTINYVNDPKVTGLFSDNTIAGATQNPCGYDPYTGLPTDDCGNPISFGATSTNGMYLEMDQTTKQITIHVRDGITTAYDVEQLIESDPLTKQLFAVEQRGNGSGVISMQDDTLLTAGGEWPPGYLNGAKLLFGEDASDYYLIFKSAEYGSDQFVDVQAMGADGKATSFKVYDTSGKAAEKVYGKDVDALINGVKAVGDGLNVSLNTSTLSLDFTLAENAGTEVGYGTDFTINGGGATFQIGPDVVSNQQLVVGIQSVNTVKLGGPSGQLYQLRSGQNASLTTDTNKAYRIVEEAIVSIAQTRGRLGTIQRATFDTNINVLNSTLEAITAAESQIRDTDFAEETSNLTRAQILVQSNISTLGIANQLPNYMLSLLSR